MSIQKILQQIKKNKVFLISTHVNPDADGLGSALALAHFLKDLGKKAHVVIDEAVPARFYFLKGVSQIKAYAQIKRMSYDCAIILDCGDLSRIGKVKTLLKETKPIVNIDHHVTNDLFGDLNLVDAQSSSTAEIIYLLIKRIKGKINKDIAIYIYAGIMTDTGSFRFNNTTGRTHKVIAELMNFNIPVVDLYKRFYEDVSLKDLKILTEVLGGFNVFCEGQVLTVVLRKKVLSRISVEFDLRDAIFRFLRHIKGAKMFVIFTEATSSQTRVNLRSVPGSDVAIIAKQFAGGGHKQASGCTIEKSLGEAQRMVLRCIKKVL